MVFCIHDGKELTGPFCAQCGKKSVAFAQKHSVEEPTGPFCAHCGQASKKIAQTDKLDMKEQESQKNEKILELSDLDKDNVFLTLEDGMIKIGAYDEKRQLTFDYPKCITVKIDHNKKNEKCVLINYEYNDGKVELWFPISEYEKITMFLNILVTLGALQKTILRSNSIQYSETKDRKKVEPAPKILELSDMDEDKVFLTLEDGMIKIEYYDENGEKRFHYPDAIFVNLKETPEGEKCFVIDYDDGDENFEHFFPNSKYGKITIFLDNLVALGALKRSILRGEGLEYSKTTERKQVKPASLIARTDEYMGQPNPYLLHFI